MFRQGHLRKLPRQSIGICFLQHLGLCPKSECGKCRVVLFRIDGKDTKPGIRTLGSVFLQIGRGKRPDCRRVPGTELTAHGTVMRGILDLFMDEQLVSGDKTRFSKPENLHFAAHVFQQLTGSDALQIVGIIDADQKCFLHGYSAETDTLAARISSPSIMASASSSLMG